MRLTTAICRTASTRGTLYKLSDGGGLQLWINASGSKTWRLAYRINGKQSTLTLGRYPDLGLQEARSAREAAKEKLAAGTNPRTAMVSVVHSFRNVALEWYERCRPAWKESHSFRVMQRLEKDVFPFIGERDIGSLERMEILELLRRVEARGAIDMAKRVRQVIRKVMGYAIATGRAHLDPTDRLVEALMRASKVKHRTFVREKDLPAVLRMIDRYDGDWQTRLALLLTIQTMVRTNETRFARWDEFELDRKDPLWRIPAERMKGGQEHIVPLAQQTVALLKEIKRSSGRSAYLFPSAKTRSGFISANTMLYALYRMGLRGSATVHGFRSTASTILNETGQFPSDWIERQLAHTEQNEIRAAYNTAEWLPQRRGMMQWWADRLDEILVLQR